MNPEVLAHVTQLIEGYFKRPITQMNKDQALVPSTCTILHNKVGTAPGMWIENNSKIYISMPGVPFEMKAIMENEVIPKLVLHFKTPIIYHKIIKTIGIGESYLSDLIQDWELSLPKHIKLAYLPSRYCKT